MLSIRLIFVLGLTSQLAYGVFAMECSIGGIPLSCPLTLDYGDSGYCCKNINEGLGGCCELSEFVWENYGVLIISLGVGFLLLLTICCCCFCSCCFCARRKAQLRNPYGPLTNVQGRSENPIQAVYLIQRTNPLASAPNNP